MHLAVAVVKVLDDPLSVLLAKSSGRGEGLGDGLASRKVLNDGCSGLGGGSSDGELDLVAGLDGDAGEIVGVVGVPFIPG